MFEDSFYIRRVNLAISLLSPRAEYDCAEFGKAVSVKKQTTKRRQPPPVLLYSVRQGGQALNVPARLFHTLKSRQLQWDCGVAENQRLYFLQGNGSIKHSRIMGIGGFVTLGVAAARAGMQYDVGSI